jgi:nitroimidazol reductase NimA-like FMN-containing flavoprotein (pyridoxamine 5'-phosphate oxidase superfamily)
LVAEVLSPSTATRDRTDKFDLYEQHGVLEYWIIDPRDSLIEVYTREENAVRRADRAVDDEGWIKQMLKTAAVGNMASVYDGQPFINSNIFVYDEDANAIYIHTARKGRTRANLETPQAPPKVCFSVMEMGRLLPADEALEFSVEYAGVVVFGTAQVIDDSEGEATHALQQMLDKYAPHLTAGEDYRPPVPEELKRTTVMRIDIDKWSGKKKEVDDFDGAFWYPDSPMLASNRG